MVFGKHFDTFKAVVESFSLVVRSREHGFA